ncbi:MAG: SRPBCC domain-containing protein [Bacteroidetes bacterium]|nr:SRPBCC domain-containing protein [Bacteroidota bacterium]
MNKLKAEPFVIERTLNATVRKVWDAITQKEQMKQWYFDLAQFEPEVGFEFSFTGGTPEMQYKHNCRITELVVFKKISYTWAYEGYAGESEVTFELFAEGDKTRIRLTHTGLETFPENNPDFAKKNFEAGWTELIGKLLPEYVEK